MRKLKMGSMPTRKKIIPMVMGIANTIIKKLRFVDIINEAVHWDRAHWNISPGSLAKMLVLGTLTDIRIPLTHLEERLEGIDTEFFLEEPHKSDFVNESNVGEALDRIGEADYDGMYRTIALSAFRQYEIPLTRMHSDTTTISFYGEYDPEKLDLSEEEKEAILHIERGYNKDGRPECNQVVVGQITNECGVPIVSKTMDGATSDIDWNKEAIKYASELAALGFKDGIYVADCKLVTKELVTAMNDAESGLRFVSRCPANFGDSLERRMIAKAYEDGRWNMIGCISETKEATQYKGISFVEEICGAPMRLLVLESDTLCEKARHAAAQKKKALTPLIKELEHKRWMCLADAEAERSRFMGMKQLALFDCDVSIEKRSVEKWPRGRRSMDTRPSIVETYHLHVDRLSESIPAYQEFLQRESCVVLISNVTDGMSDEDLLRTYKGQHVVESSFRMLKSPQLASVIYLKSQTRIQALNMLLTFSLLLRAIIQYRLREGLSAFKEERPGEKIYAGWGGRELKSPTFKLLYEHSINCCFVRENCDEYSFEWPSIETRSRVEPLLGLLGLRLEQIME
jgi:transposase